VSLRSILVLKQIKPLQPSLDGSSGMPLLKGFSLLLKIVCCTFQLIPGKRPIQRILIKNEQEKLTQEALYNFNIYFYYHTHFIYLFSE
tara:strand:- start:172443 stop:172706 length:264 start_codon:yes stop_codon:yes gene_type:complete